MVSRGRCSSAAVACRGRIRLSPDERTHVTLGITSVDSERFRVFLQILILYDSPPLIQNAGASLFHHRSPGNFQGSECECYLCFELDT